ncbi:MAG: diaminopimelate dehydrogenase [Turicibacter sp.]|nr:diaminopimelate dehydrogenase [Turicibacter sp.]
MEKIKIGIVGYGNLGRGVELSLAQNPDMELVAVFSRRDPSSLTLITEGVQAAHMADILTYKGKIDVMILCGGSATDLPLQSPQIAAHFNLIDSFDTHAKIPEHFDHVNKAATVGSTISIISAGWDPGLFSLNRLYAEAVLPKGETFTFWGPGLSQGHSDAIRRIKGVANAVQYTVPIEEAVNQARAGQGASLTTRDKHLRECYVVAEPDADQAAIAETIKTMPDYFADYDTTVTFISADELQEKHSAMPHGGFVIRSGETGLDGNKHTIEYSLTEDSNPEFTSAVLVCYARAAYRLNQKGESGARTVFDIAPALLSIKTNEQLRAEML